ncbi:hypothetical protein GALMADRAFT_1043988 [Galerina marginata CBS 339.88]|uniref:Secreted protein n=1 Tax=Galerina marginata (strain CBS 339.88) TaxID=685588 RepID=A0A067SL15_GALM3|nr:hypothetical protein GALMADRAFT_1043988 [Galerina marginata CBS 339.88]
MRRVRFFFLVLFSQSCNSWRPYDVLLVAQYLLLKYNAVFRKSDRLGHRCRGTSHPHLEPRTSHPHLTFESPEAAESIPAHLQRTSHLVTPAIRTSHLSVTFCIAPPCAPRTPHLPSNGSHLRGSNLTPRTCTSHLAPRTRTLQPHVAPRTSHFISPLELRTSSLFAPLLCTSLSGSQNQGCGRRFAARFSFPKPLCSPLPTSTRRLFPHVGWVQTLLEIALTAHDLQLGSSLVVIQR